MDKINDGGPAFPNDAAALRKEQEGMRLRDYFASRAMQAWLSGHVAHYGHEAFWALDAIAQSSYEMADAMIKAREEQP